jgi:hypothetical protein
MADGSRVRSKAFIVMTVRVPVFLVTDRYNRDRRSKHPLPGIDSL